MNHSFRKIKFTLVELIVAMAVFSILLLLMLQFFTGAQTIWHGMEKRNEIYANARIAMDLMTAQLQNTFYTNAGIPFVIVNPDTDDSRIYFATRTGDQFPGNSSLKYMTFQRNNITAANSETNAEQEQLRVAVFCDTSPGTPDFSSFFPPYGVNPVTNFTQATNLLPSRLDGLLTNTQFSSAIADNVTAFRIIPYRLDSDNDIVRDTSSPVQQVPYLVELKLSLLTPEDFSRWLAITNPTDRDNFREENEYTFSRTVYLGNRRDD